TSQTHTAPPPHATSLARLREFAGRDPALARAMDEYAAGSTSIDLQAPEAFNAFVVDAVAAHSTVLAVAATARDGEELAGDLADGLAGLVGAVQGAFYPAWERLPPERLSRCSDAVGRRLAVVRRLAHPGPEPGPTGPVRVVVAPVRSVLQPQVKGLAELAPV